MGIYRWPVDSPHKGPKTRKMFPFDDVIMIFCQPNDIFQNGRRKLVALRDLSVEYKWPACQSKEPTVNAILTLQWRHNERDGIANHQPLASVRGIHRSPVNSPRNDQWRRPLMFSSICAWINGWVNNRKAGDLRRHRAHYHATVMLGPKFTSKYQPHFFGYR